MTFQFNEATGRSRIVVGGVTGTSSRTWGPSRPRSNRSDFESMGTGGLERARPSSLGCGSQNVAARAVQKWRACTARSAPSCPRIVRRSHCRYHHNAAGWRWKHHGSYTRQASPTEIPRYRCCHCGATFSSQTFHTTYHLKRPELQVPLFHRIDAGSGFRQMARDEVPRTARSSIRVSRLGRHALLFMSRHRPSGPPRAVGDRRFESFAYSQYHPLHRNLGIGGDTGFHYAFTHCRCAARAP